MCVCVCVCKLKTDKIIRLQFFSSETTYLVKIVSNAEKSGEYHRLAFENEPICEKCTASLSQRLPLD